MHLLSYVAHYHPTVTVRFYNVYIFASLLIVWYLKKAATTFYLTVQMFDMSNFVCFMLRYIIFLIVTTIGGLFYVIWWPRNKNLFKFCLKKNTIYYDRM